MDLTQPRWSQDTYAGRAKHFFTVTNPLNVLLSKKDLEDARSLYMRARNKEKLPEGVNEDDLWQAKYRYESAYHPDTKEKMFILGRMSAQVPMNMTITGCMLTFYRTAPAVIFWQWINQSFNAIVNYTNRSGDAPISTQRLLTSYVCATTGAVGTALTLNNLTKKLPSLVGRYVPFAAVAAANCINIPLMRSRELTSGIPVLSDSGERVGESKNAAKKAIIQVTFSRIGMALPGMAIPPLVMNRLAKGNFLKRYPWMNAPIQVGIVGFCLAFATPLCCALFPQMSSIAVSKLEPELQKKIEENGLNVDTVYFNKGL
ncbi:sideroflexin-1-like isoform X2 [Clavelina lepadiformis]|uniref:Sidoreflexin n=1 Tax=Clavelina lepadiformis TaxID=159417 RepID=A0ABP0GBU9_CLALP